MDSEELENSKSLSEKNADCKLIQIQCLKDNASCTEELITCEVCGHKNSKNTGICTMCSNYLFK